MRSLRPLAVAALLLAACPSSSGPADMSDGFGETPPADDIDLAAESTRLGVRGTFATSMNASKAVTELFVKEDPTLDVKRTAAANADAVAQQLHASLASCATASITHAPSDVNIALAFHGVCSVGANTFAGGATAKVEKGAGSITVAFTFTSLMVNGRTIDGTASVTTMDDTSFAATIDITDGATHATLVGALALDASGAGATLDGTGSHSVAASAPVIYTASGVHHVFGACYADGGTLTWGATLTGKSGRSYRITETLSFNAQTPATGMATATIAGIATPVTLSPYGTCPHP